jgi:hypothetical protein
MQGSFKALGADWNSALAPGADDEAQRQKRSDDVEQQLAWFTRMRNNPQAPAPPNPMAYAQIFPPTPHFKYRGETFYILNGPMREDMECQNGAYGHYLVTTTDIIAHPGYARPIHSRIEIAPARRVQPDQDAPGMLYGDTLLVPDPTYCIPYVHYTTPTLAQANPYREVGLERLKEALESAEALDLAFARRMEGLGNVAPQACWDCLDPDYDPSDRQAVMDQFMAKYLGRFYNGIDPELGPATSLVSDEVLHKHKAFCQAWVKKHYKTLTPAITAPAESLAAEFYPYIEPWFEPNRKLTHAELARVLMRFEPTAAEFATCLHYYSTSLEQARGGRNASYKQMSTVSTNRAITHKRFGDLLANKMIELRVVFHKLGMTPQNRYFDPLIVDWHAILGQMPETHRFFRNDSLVQGLLRQAPRRNGADGAHVPPWRTMRNAGP